MEKQALLNEISEYLQKGRAKNVKELVQQALDNGITAREILNDGLMAGLAIIGKKFRENEVFVPEVLVAARAMNGGSAILEAALLAEGVQPIGRALIGTVEGDMHDIGKNLVTMMLRGAGFEVTDIGMDVPAARFIDEAEATGVDVICISALLTTTMPRIPEIIELLKERGLRDKYIVMIGGAPVTEAFGKEVGADYYTKDAATAAEVAKAAVLERKAK